MVGGIYLNKARKPVLPVAAALAQQVAEKYPDCDVEVNEGGQPVYYYIISVE